ncbi:MAG: ABC transporter substrate-binding protein [Rhizobiaceae bacterium]
MKAYIVAMATASCALMASYAAAEDYKIAVVHSLTGNVGQVGVPVVNAIKLAADQVNASGLLGDDKIVLEVQDTASDKGQAVTLITRYGSDPSFLAILGPTSSIDGLATSPVANDLNVPMFTTAISAEVLKAGPWVFKGTAPTSDLMKGMADYAVGKLQVKTCSLIFGRDNDAHVSAKRVFETAVKEGGVEIVSEDGVLVSDTDYSAVATKVASLNPDCVLVAELGPQSANIIIQLRQAGLADTVKIVGTTSMATRSYLQTAGAAAEGTYFPADFVPGGSNDMGKAFAEAYQQAYGMPADNYAAVAYTILDLTAHAIKNAGEGVTRESLREQLTAIKDAPTVLGDGTFSLDEERLPHYGVSLLTVKDGAFVGAE